MKRHLGMETSPLLARAVTTTSTGTEGAWRPSSATIPVGRSCTTAPISTSGEDSLTELARLATMACTSPEPGAD